MLARILHYIWLLIVAALFLVAAVLLAGRLWVPTLADYRAEVETLASKALGKTVTIGIIQGTWRGLNPVLKLRDVAIADPGQPAAALVIGEIWIGIDAKNYLHNRRLSLASIDVIGADVMVIRDPDGTFRIDRMASAPGGDTSLAELLDINRLSIHDSVITYEDRQAERHPIRLSDVTLTLDNAGKNSHLTGYVMLPSQLGHRVDVSARIRNIKEPFDQWGGQFYFQGHALAISRENLSVIAPDINISGTADLRSWVDLKRGQLKSLRGELEVTALNLHQQGEAAGTDYMFDSLSGRFGWRKRPGGWQFTTQQLTVEQGDTVREGAGISIAKRGLRDAVYYNGELRRLYLEELQSLARTASGMPEEQRQRIARLQPEGLIETLTVDIRQAGGRSEVLWLDMTFRDLGIRPADAPGFSGLRGSVTGTPANGALWLKARHVGFSNASVFRDPLLFDDVNGEIGWQWQSGHLQVTGNDLYLANPDLALVGQLGLTFPPEEAAPVIDLQVDVQRARLGRISHYLPARVMPVKGVAWLDRSLVSGDIRDGSVVLKGPLDKLPFDNGEGRLEVRLPVTDAVLDYNAEWTPIRDLDAQVDFTGRSMVIVSHQGQIRTASLKHVNAGIKDIIKPDLVLKGTVAGELSVMLAELGNSSLGELYGGFVDRVTGTGDAALDLDVFVPLHGKGREIGVKGKITLANNGLKVNASGLGFEHIKGRLAFDSSGITGKDLQARLLGTLVRVDVRTEPPDAVTNIRVRGALDIASIVAEEQPVFDGILNGLSDWDMQLRIARLKGRKETPDVSLELASSLEGMAVDLPAPFGKTAAVSRPVSVTVEKVVHPQRILRFRYADLLQGALQAGTGERGMVLQRGQLMTGSQSAVIPETRELSIGGRLQRFSLPEWQPVLSRFDGGDGPPVRLDMEIGSLELLQHSLEDVSLQGRDTGSGQTYTFAGPTIEGSVRLDRSDSAIERVTADLKLLKLKSLEDTTESESASDPGDFPELDVKVSELKYEGRKIGKVRVQTRNRPGAVQVDRFAVESKMLSLEATGDWHMEAGQQVSQFDIEVTGGKLEKLLKEFDYKEEVAGGDIHGTLRARWPGAPWAIRPSIVDGKLHLVIKDGQLLNVKPGAGRVFGLVSLHTLPRRLSLDFSDLFKKGYTFDRIEGHFVLNDGDAYTSDLLIEGPAARIEISGRIGLADEDYDELITVVPHVSSSLPIAGVIAGGPVVGAVLLLADQLLGDELEKRTKFTHKQYTVTGPWADPVYTEMKGKPKKLVLPEAQDSPAFGEVE